MKTPRWAHKAAEPDAEVLALLGKAVADLSGLDQWFDAHAAQNYADGVFASTISQVADRLVRLRRLRPAEREAVREVVLAHFHVIERVIG